MKKSQFVLSGFAALGVFFLLILGFENCGRPNQINPLDLNMASAQVPGPVAQAYPAADTTVPTAIWTKIPFDTAEFDFSGVLDYNNYRMVPTKPGYYRIHLSVGINMTGTAGFTIYAGIYKNGTLAKQTANLINYTSAFTQTLSVDAILYFNGTSDYLEGFAYTNSGTATVTSGSANTWLSAEFVRSQ